MYEIKLEKARKVKGDVQIEHYDNGELGFIFPKVVRDKFDKIFKGGTIDVSVSLGEQDKTMIVVVNIPKRTYIA